MATTKDLQPIRNAISSADYSFITRRALEISALLDSSTQERFAEVFPDVDPHWHVVTVMPGQERTAADDLSDRRFGVYLPESEHTEIRRGRVVDLKRLMLPGYVFIFVWDVDRHMDRIRACKGVRGLLFVSGHVAVLSDRLIDRIRIAENYERPLKGLVAKPRQRRSHKPKSLPTGCFTADEIVGVHAYSPFIDELRSAADEVRLNAFHKALGLAA